MTEENCAEILLDRPGRITLVRVVTGLVAKTTEYDLVEGAGMTEGDWLDAIDLIPPSFAPDSVHYSATMGQATPEVTTVWRQKF